MLRPRVLTLLIPFLLVGCERPSDPVQPTAGTDTTAATPAAQSTPAATTTPATPAPLPTPVTGTTPVNPDAATAGTTSSGTSANSAQAVLMPTEGRSAGGEISLQAEAGGVRLTGRLTGLTPGAQHGFHIHEKGDCSAPDATSAGNHFNPAGTPHGRIDTAPHHAGDMNNAQADAQGQAEVNQLLTGIELGTNGANDALGRAIIVHEQPDDYSSQPSGNAGARIACGVIGRTVSPGAGEEVPADSDPS